LAKRSGRVAGLTLQLCLWRLHTETADEENAELLKWTQPLQTLSGIPGVKLELELKGYIAHKDDLFITQWLKQHGQTIKQLTVQVQISKDMLKLEDFAAPAAPCSSINLTIEHDDMLLDLAELAPLAGSLGCLSIQSESDGSLLGGVRTLSSLQQLTSLHLHNMELNNEEPWDHMAKLTSLKQLSMKWVPLGIPRHCQH
jgi:hypothetical protein